MRHVELALPSDRPKVERYVVWSVVLSNVIAFFPQRMDVYFAELRGTAPWEGTVLKFLDKSQMFVMHNYGEIKAVMTSDRNRPKMERVDARIRDLITSREKETSDDTGARDRVHPRQDTPERGGDTDDDDEVARSDEIR